MKKFLSALIVLFWFNNHITQAQTTNISGPAGSGQFGHSVTVLTNGNYVVTDPFYDSSDGQDVGAVYLYNGLSHTLISKLTGSTPNDRVGNHSVTPLNNGNFVVVSNFWNKEGITSVGAVTWVNGVTGLNDIVSTGNSLVGSTKDDHVGSGQVIALPNGNYVVSSAGWRNKSLNQGNAVTWGNGLTGVKGQLSSENSLVSNYDVDANFPLSGGTLVFVLPNSNYLVSATLWRNGEATNAGSLTWANGQSGISGEISEAISLVGSTKDDMVGLSVTILSNGNYVTNTIKYDSGLLVDVGAVTWGDANIGVRGIINYGNSLIGSSNFDEVGMSITPLTNGNYVIGSGTFNYQGVIDVGAVTLCNGLTGLTGVIDHFNSLVGRRYLDQVGSSSWFGGIFALPNGNFVVSTPTWDYSSDALDAGAVTWVSGEYGISGTIDGTNSLIGTVEDEQIGSRQGGGVIVLPNGNYLIASAFWNNGLVITKAGAVTWGSGSEGVIGTIDNTNSITGSKINDQVGLGGITVLTNGNYIINSPVWDNGDIVDAGAVTWGNGLQALSGEVSSTNSLVGSSASDQIGTGISGIAALANGNYVVRSYLWDNNGVVNAGAVTFGNGLSGVTGPITTVNSLVGTKLNDQVGFSSIRVLNNGNYVVISYNWDNGSVADAGAATWGDGTVGTVGVVNNINSLVGTTGGDQIGFGGVTLLSNSNYLIRSARWRNGTVTNAGAITWGSGISGISGNINTENSLLGSGVNDQIGSGGITAIENGNYIIDSPDWDNGAIVNNGAITFGNGTIGTNGIISACNSVLGSGTVGIARVVYNSVFNYIIVSKQADNSLILFNPSGMTLAVSTDASLTDIAGMGPTPMLANSDCRIVATISASGNNPVSGTVDAKTWIEESVPLYSGNPYVARHYQVTPDVDAATATGRLTLYFTQGEFDDFNDNPKTVTKLPAHGSDQVGKANLRVTKLSGVSSDNSGSPGSYGSNGLSTINPEDKNVIWNAALSRWEVTFEVAGFSGFFVQTPSIPLPVNLISFEAKKLETDVVLKWEIAEAKNFSHFQVERSADAKHFYSFETIRFADLTTKYQVVDSDPAHFADVYGQLYYRLKMVDNDGSFAYSSMQRLSFPSSGGFVYPNPAGQILYLDVSEYSGLESVELISNQGILLSRHRAVGKDGISVSDLAAGIYQVKVIRKNGMMKTQKLVIAR